MTIEQKAREIVDSRYGNTYVHRPHNDILIRQDADIIYLSPEAAEELAQAIRALIEEQKV